MAAAASTLSAYAPPAVEYDQPPLWGVSSQPASDEQLEQLEKRRLALNRQLSGLAVARRLMALWHAIHVPLGLALFTAAFLHILAAIYYATLLR